MPKLGLERHVVDPAVYENSVKRFRAARIVLPTFAELADPRRLPARITAALAAVDPQAPHPLNLFRVHWYNAPDGQGTLEVPEFTVLPHSLTGVEAPIAVLFGDRFPMINSHKVLAAFGCLAPRLITGQFDPTRHRAIWPSTGNYCRGGVAISRIMQCRGVAILPEGMSQERFDWLRKWVDSPGDIIRTPGSESNVKEIYDKCAELDRDPLNIIFNQFCEFGNYLVHFTCTGEAFARVFEALRHEHTSLTLRAFVASSGSSGTLGAGDYLKERHGCRIAVAEALECPTILYNGFGEHNIQGIGDKHIPLIHNVMNTDFAVAVSDVSTDGLNVLFNSPAGHHFLNRRKKLPPSSIRQLERLGLSGLCNVIAAIKIAKHLHLGPQDLVMTVATDPSAMYRTERDKTLGRRYPHGFDELDAAELFGQCLGGAGTDHVLELSHTDRERVFNLGYYTWVEQQGVSVEEFKARKEIRFWLGLRDLLAAWDALITEFNQRTKAADAL
ncbi:MAG: pyridoxal-5'-phosphate-dependent protein subunit beta [Planctomycetota bacterium]